MHENVQVECPRCRSEADPQAFSPIECVFFCQNCNEIACEDCTKPFISLFYCPCCKFEIPSGMAREQSAKCPRGCLTCLDCSVFLKHEKRDGKSIQICPNCSVIHQDHQDENDANQVCHSNFQRLRQKFHQNSTEFFELEPFERPKKPASQIVRTALRTQIGRTCSLCNQILESCQMSGTTFEFPISKRISLSLLDLKVILWKDGRLLLQIRNCQPQPVRLQIQGISPLKLASSMQQNPYYEMEKIVNLWKNHNSSIGVVLLDQQENLCWISMKELEADQTVAFELQSFPSIIVKLNRT